MAKVKFTPSNSATNTIKTSTLQAKVKVQNKLNVSLLILAISLVINLYALYIRIHH